MTDYSNMTRCEAVERCIGLEREVKRIVESVGRDPARLVAALERISALPIDTCKTENDYRLAGAKAIALSELDTYREQKP